LDELVGLSKQQRILIILACGFILLTLSVPVLDMAPVTSDPSFSQQDLMYYLSQENQTEFAHYNIGNTWTYHPTCAPQVYIDVVDLDGVASVWFSYKRSNESQWNNKSMNPSGLGENTFMGYFQSTVSEFTTVFNITFFANDSLGHILESELYELSIHYSHDPPPPENNLFFQILVVGTSIIVGFSALVIIDKRTSKKTIINASNL